MNQLLYLKLILITLRRTNHAWHHAFGNLLRHTTKCRCLFCVKNYSHGCCGSTTVVCTCSATCFSCEFSFVFSFMPLLAVTSPFSSPLEPDETSTDDDDDDKNGSSCDNETALLAYAWSWLACRNWRHALSPYKATCKPRKSCVRLHLLRLILCLGLFARTHDASVTGQWKSSWRLRR